MDQTATCRRDNGSTRRRGLGCSGSAMESDALPFAGVRGGLRGAVVPFSILFYLNKDDTRRMRIDERTSQLQADLWCGPRTGHCTTNAGRGAGARWHERRDQFAGLYASGVLEPDSHRRVVSHGGHRAMLQRAVRLPVAKRQRRGKACSRATTCRFDCLPSDSRHRCSAAWLDRGQTTEPGKFGEVAWALKFVVLGHLSRLCSVLLSALLPRTMYSRIVDTTRTGLGSSNSHQSALAAS